MHTADSEARVSSTGKQRSALRLDAELWEQVKKVAKREDRTGANLVTHLVRQYVESREDQ